MGMTDVYRKLFEEKARPTTEAERVNASITLTLSESVDRLDKQIVELIKANKILASAVKDLMEKPGVAKEEGPPLDATPFPTGVASSAATTTVTPASLDDVVTANVPDAGSGPARNAAPIPTPPKK